MEENFLLCMNLFHCVAVKDTEKKTYFAHQKLKKK